MKEKTYYTQTTSDYGKFGKILGNRTLNQKHIKKMAAAIKESNSCSFSLVVDVNESMEIIDGQHRVAALEILGLPVEYRTHKNGTTLEDIQRMNTHQKNWTINDHVDSWIERGRKDYELYKHFKKKYGFGHQECHDLLSGYTYNTSGTVRLKDGRFKIKSYAIAAERAEKIQQVEKYYDGWRRRSFVKAIVSLLKNPKYNHRTFLEKLAYQSGKMLHQSNQLDYLRQIQKIYNYKSREKVNLFAE